MRTWVLTIIFIGMTIGFLLALGIVALLRAGFGGEDLALSVAFTIFVVFLAVLLIGYVYKMIR